HTPLEESGVHSVVNNTFLGCSVHAKTPSRTRCELKKLFLISIMVIVAYLIVGVIAAAQQPKKVARIGYLSNTDPATDSARAEGIRLALRERGYIEGQNIAIEYRYRYGRPDRESGLAA